MSASRGDVVLAWYPFASGHDSLVSCNNLATIEQALIHRTIGALSPTLLLQLDACLKAALQIT
jgi:hypothetical protein